MSLKCHYVKLCDPAPGHREPAVEGVATEASSGCVVFSILKPKRFVCDKLLLNYHDLRVALTFGSHGGKLQLAGHVG